MTTAAEIRKIENDAILAAQRATVLAMIGDKEEAAKFRAVADELFEKANAMMIERYGRKLSSNELMQIEHDEECARLGLPLDTKYLDLWAAQAAESTGA
ncbi:hypothetical protein C4587_00735 [Candidatus Parcubacteria bacterium]|nr:MAG: hypothetical protein C4587_00735 [Candidatus Parcubacteria bacterium]